MRKKTSLLGLFLLCFWWSGIALSAQGFLKAEGKVIVDSDSGEEVLLRGMGLGGWMLQEGYMLQTAGFANAQHDIRSSISDLIGEEATEEFYDLWLQNHVTRSDIDSLKSWGFNSVRLPMHYNLYALPIEEEPIRGQHTWLERGFTMTDSLISWCAANEMYVVLDLHAAPGGQGRDEGISDYDDTKPSLWESQANQDKTVALWRRLAERYRDEIWVGGYDLINETNWPLDNNQPLKDIYLRLTEEIRAVDQNHILFIEGNWFANDFTNLTPPWDDNLVYSPHKYWSINDQASIQWVIDIRDRYNVPIYFGESGENSNLWFRDAIKLLEDHNMGWAWWPMKKIESIAGPLSVIKTDGYQSLLDFWNNGGTPPSSSEATTILMETVDLLKTSSSLYQKDVIDAMFRQVQSDKTRPYRQLNIPGLIYATDFDLGFSGHAYFDIQDANYQVSTGNFTAWNNGWTLRNDGVDIEKSSDRIRTNGYNIGWTSTGEWTKYSANIESGVYQIQVRVASLNDDGSFYFGVGDAQASRSSRVNNTGGWQDWATVAVNDVVLFEEEDHIRFFIEREEFNVGSFMFTRTGPTTDVATQVLSSSSVDDHTVVININKPLDLSSNISLGDFTITINGQIVDIENVIIDPDNPRQLIVLLNTTIRSSDVIRASYSGASLQAIDGTGVASFNDVGVENNVAIVHNIPGRVEAEDFFFQSGIQLENTTDQGGGQNIGFLDRGDFLDYFIDVAETGVYLIEYRTAAQSERGGVSLALIEDDAITELNQTRFSATGGWQTWRTTSSEVRLPQGRHQLRVRITDPLFNLNWLQFSIITASSDVPLADEVKVLPNPSNGMFQLTSSELSDVLVVLDILDVQGRLVKHEVFGDSSFLDQQIDLRSQPDGIYFLRLQGKSGTYWTTRLVKTTR